MSEEKKIKITQKSPFMETLNEGDKKAWCACGYSEKNPYCDGSHSREQTGMKPVMHKAEKAGKVAFCGCKHTSTPPLCDGSHKKL
ncbi:MAG: CDGSH iron-sulfur domain-containing protein [Leptospiraceae bacterium]|nr:CDGSH iron-sulfur domain-containing protein [Leptospiraceae bacterium]MCP5497524.1 CDGSH iron-sulfur domain-containing protein [Leptospiraceae bacterium]